MEKINKILLIEKMMTKREFSVMTVFIILVLLTAVNMLANAKEDGPVAEWHFDEGVGNVLNDSSGSGNDGTTYGTMWVDGKFGKALSFNGIDDYANFGHAPILDPGGTNTLTISAWVKRATPTSKMLVVIKRDGGGYVLGIGLGSSPNQIKMTKFGVRDIYLGNFPEDTDYHNLVGVWSNNGTYLYIDGELNAKSNEKSNFIRSPKGNVLIGGDYLTDHGYANGIIDEVRIYNRSLSAEEIKGYYGEKQTPNKKSDSNTNSASVLLTAEKIDIELGDDAILKLSAVSLITKPNMSVQAIIGVPSGVSVTSTTFSQTMTNQYTSKYDLAPGDNRDIEIKIRANHPGSFNITGRIIYYFGGDISTGEDHTQEVTIKVRQKELDIRTPVPVPTSPGFEIITGLIVLLVIRFSNRYL